MQVGGHTVFPSEGGVELLLVDVDGRIDRCHGVLQIQCDSSWAGLGDSEGVGEPFRDLVVLGGSGSGPEVIRLEQDLVSDLE